MTGRATASRVRQDYFQWLCELVNIATGPAPYWLLARDLHAVQFIPFVPNDDNREKDGLALREEYLRENQHASSGPDIGACSVLEMTIALASRMSFELEAADDDVDHTADYFWEIMDNLGLTKYTDEAYVDLNGITECVEIITALVQRKYAPNGDGGMFPLFNPPRDQRLVEIWYQMNKYLEERYEY